MNTILKRGLTLLITPILTYVLRNVLDYLLKERKEKIIVKFLENLDLIMIMLCITCIIALLIYWQFTNLRDRTNAFIIITHIRNKRLFVKLYDNVTHFRLPDETDEDLWERLPEGGGFRDYLKQEFNIVRNSLMNNMGHRSINDIDKLMKKYYPNAFFKKKVK